jgi:hypothetical protein
VPYQLGFIPCGSFAAALLAGQANGVPPICFLCKSGQFVVGTLPPFYLLQKEAEIGIRQLLKPIPLQCQLLHIIVQVLTE